MENSQESGAPPSKALYRVHKVMISTALLFSAGFAFLKLNQGEFGMGGFFAVTTVALGAYFSWFLRTKASKA